MAKPTQTTDFVPFADDDASLNLAELTLENQGQQVNLYGSVTFTLDRQSLAHACKLHDILGQIVGYLQAHDAQDFDRSDHQAHQQANVDTIRNPFL